MSHMSLPSAIFLCLNGSMKAKNWLLTGNQQSKLELIFLAEPRSLWLLNFLVLTFGRDVGKVRVGDASLSFRYLRECEIHPALKAEADELLGYEEVCLHGEIFQGRKPCVYNLININWVQKTELWRCHWWWIKSCSPRQWVSVWGHFTD